MYYFTYLLLPHQLLFPLPFCVNDTKREEKQQQKKTLFHFILAKIRNPTDRNKVLTLETPSVNVK